MTSSRSYYGVVVVVVDRQGRHLHCDAWVSVTFRINIGGGTNHAVECLTTKPSEDGVYYFEAVHEFKCAGDFLLEFTATRHRVTSLVKKRGDATSGKEHLAPLLWPVKVRSRSLTAGNKTFLTSLEAVQCQDVSTWSGPDMEAVLALRLALMEIHRVLPRGALHNNPADYASTSQVT